MGDVGFGPLDFHEKDTEATTYDIVPRDALKIAESRLARVEQGVREIRERIAEEEKNALWCPDCKAFREREREPDFYCGGHWIALNQLRFALRAIGEEK